MPRTKLGCLVDIIVNLATLLLLLALAFGIYCFFRPGAWNRMVNRITKFWDDTKSGGDRVVNNSWGKFKQKGDHLVESVPRDKRK